MVVSYFFLMNKTGIQDPFVYPTTKLDTNTGEPVNKSSHRTRWKSWNICGLSGCTWNAVHCALILLCKARHNESHSPELHPTVPAKWSSMMARSRVRLTWEQKLSVLDECQRCGLTGGQHSLSEVRWWAEHDLELSYFKWNTLSMTFAPSLTGKEPHLFSNTRNYYWHSLAYHY